MELWTATLENGNPVFPDYEASSLGGLKQRIAKHFFESHQSAIVNLKTVEWIDEEDKIHPVQAIGIRGIGVDIEGIIQQMYLELNDGFSTAMPVVL